MKFQTNLIDIEKQERLMKKVDRLCKLHKCNPIDLLVMSMDAQRELKIANKNNKK